MAWDINEFTKWKKEHIECFTTCLDLFSRDSREYRQLKKCIEELKKLQ